MTPHPPAWRRFPGFPRARGQMTTIPCIPSHFCGATAGPPAPILTCARWRFLIVRNRATSGSTVPLSPEETWVPRRAATRVGVGPYRNGPVEFAQRETLGQQRDYDPSRAFWSVLALRSSLTDLSRGSPPTMIMTCHE